MLVPRELLEDMANGNCLPFVGAGFSKNADLPNGTKMPSWSELCDELAEGSRYYGVIRQFGNNPSICEQVR